MQVAPDFSSAVVRVVLLALAGAVACEGDRAFFSPLGPSSGEVSGFHEPSRFVDADFVYVRPPLDACSPVLLGDVLDKVSISDRYWSGTGKQYLASPQSPWWTPMARQPDGVWMVRVKTPVGRPDWYRPDGWPDRYAVSILDSCLEQARPSGDDVYLNGVLLTDRRPDGVGDELVTFELREDGTVVP